MTNACSILNKITAVICQLIVLVIGFVLIYSILDTRKEEKVYNYTDMLITYKNYIVVGKTEVHDIPKLYLMNPFNKGHTYNIVDEKIHVTKEVYLNTFVGDTIGKTKFVFIR